MKTLTTERLRDLQRSGQDFMLINTLDPKSFSETQIPTAINIPQASPEFTDRVLRATGGFDRPVVVYCASSDCDSSTKAAHKLEAAGFTQVYEYEGGAGAWREEVEAQALDA